MRYRVRNFRCFEAVYGERALVDYDFSKASLLFLVGADILVTGKVEVMIYTQEFKNGKMSRHFQLEANMTLSSAVAADRRLPMSTANQKASVSAHIILSLVLPLVSLDNKFKSEVTKAAQQLKQLKGVLVPVFKIKCSVVSFSC
jgi:molybdopterin-containing oxidoreductase family iron-sulfur binding subunit